MERLLKLCQIFDCDLADLISAAGESESEKKTDRDSAESELKPESKETTGKVGRFMHTCTFRAVCAAALMLAVILLAVGISRRTLTGSEELTSLYHYKTDAAAEIIAAESVHTYYEIVQNRLREGRDDCICNTIMYLVEDEEQDFLDTSAFSYALYTETYSHGNAFSVTLSVVTVYDGETERPGLVWVDTAPQALTEFEVDTSVLKGDDTVTDDTLIYICGYTVRIPQKTMDSAFAEQYGYRKWQTGSYYKSEHIILIRESVF